MATLSAVDAAAADAYLDRIDAARPACLDADALRALQRRHLLAVPVGRGTGPLHEPAIFDKLVRRRLGGCGHECNGLFALLLTALGFQVDRLAARVPAGEGFGPPFEHLTLRVAAPESPWPWLVDVGFDRFGEQPLRMDSRREQRLPAGTFRLADADQGDLLVLREAAPLYLVERRARSLPDFELACRWHRADRSAFLAEMA